MFPVAFLGTRDTTTSKQNRQNKLMKEKHVPQCNWLTDANSSIVDRIFNSYLAWLNIWIGHTINYEV